ncbi:hypothetical protein [Streptomyces parvus]|uniref:hypothetical protein n=1 Tax=Streptomyces parvus TaxID=66428 RepID=UPI003D750F43
MRLNRQELADRCAQIDWDDARGAHRTSRTLLRRLAGDRELLSELVLGIPADPWRKKRSEFHPLMNKLCLLEDPEAGYQLRLHDFRVSDLDIVPHDHKYSFSVYILSGGYTHVWNRRTNGVYEGDFTTRDIAPGVVSLEGPGACYTLQYSLIHQTVVQPGTVSLFLRGPKRLDRWHAADDLMDHLKGYEAPKKDGSSHQGSTPLSDEAYASVRDSLIQRGIITNRRPIDVVA